MLPCDWPADSRGQPRSLSHHIRTCARGGRRTDPADGLVVHRSPLTSLFCLLQHLVCISIALPRPRCRGWTQRAIDRKLDKYDTFSSTSYILLFVIIPETCSLSRIQIRHGGLNMLPPPALHACSETCPFHIIPNVSLAGAEDSTRPTRPLQTNIDSDPTASTYT